MSGEPCLQIGEAGEVEQFVPKFIQLFRRELVKAVGYPLRKRTEPPLELPGKKLFFALRFALRFALCFTPRFAFCQDRPVCALLLHIANSFQ